MELTIHPLSELFEQLGLPSDVSSIEAFILQHSPIPDDMELCAAPFWTSTQAHFLREEWVNDADWAPTVDYLNAALRQSKKKE